MPGPRIVAVPRADLERFVDVGRDVERAPEWIPPLRAVELADLSGGAVPGGTVQAFACEVGGRWVGRIAALVEPRLADASGAPIGQIGYYACPDDPAASGALFEAALGSLRARGCREVLGPMDGGVHRRHRLMTRGFERAPFLLEPRNPPWYPAQFLAAGLRRVAGWRGYDLAREALPPLRDRVAALARRRAGGLDLEFLDPGDRAGALSRVHRLLDAVWAGHPAWRPISLAELAGTFGALLPLLPPRHLVILKDERGDDVGMGFMYPDWADEVRALDGDASGWARWMGRGRAGRAVAHTVAIRPEVRGRAAGAKVIAAGLEVALEAGYEELHLALTTQSFRYLDHRLAATREYALYGRPLYGRAP